MSEMASKPGTFGRHPFPPDRKRPIHVKGDLIHTFIYPPHRLDGSDLNRLYVSTDRLSVGTFQLAPGATFEPPDVHAGDEVYYILDGTLVQQNTTLGEFVRVRKGEGLYIPKGAYHKSYNFESGITRMLFVLAPKPWDDQMPPVEMLEQIKLKQYKGEADGVYPRVSGLAEWDLHATVEDLGRFPVEGPPARKEPQRFYHIPEEKKLLQVFGRKQPMLVRFLVSNDWVHVGEFVLPAGGVGPRHSEPQSHAGDCFLFVEQGPITVVLTTSGDAFFIGVEEGMFIPESVSYQLVNYSASQAKVIFAIGPGL